MKTIHMWLCKYGEMFCISGQHKRSLSDVKENASVSERAEYGEWDDGKLHL